MPKKTKTMQLQSSKYIKLNQNNDETLKTKKSFDN